MICRAHYPVCPVLLYDNTSLTPLMLVCVHLIMTIVIILALYNHKYHPVALPGKHAKLSRQFFICISVTSQPNPPPLVLYCVCYCIAVPPRTPQSWNTLLDTLCAFHNLNITNWQPLSQQRVWCYWHVTSAHSWRVGTHTYVHNIIHNSTIHVST